MKITGLSWIVVIAFIIIILLLFLYCSIIINSKYDDKKNKY